MISHQIMGGKVYVYRRDGSPVWQCSTYLKGRNHRVSTKEDALDQAKKFAENWYLSKPPVTLSITHKFLSF